MQASGQRKAAIVDEKGNASPDIGRHKEIMGWLNERVYLYDLVGVAKSKSLIPVFEYAAKRYGVKYFVLDSLMCMDVAEDDYERQKEIMNEFREFVTKFNVHLFVVCHAKKPNEKKNEAKNPAGKHDISGSGHIGNLCWNVISVWRNVSKMLRYDEMSAKARTCGDKELKRQYEQKARDIFNECDTTIYICKQRKGTGELPYKQLWFDTESKQFRNKINHEVRNWINGNPTPHAGGEENVRQETFL